MQQIRNYGIGWRGSGIGWRGSGIGWRGSGIDWRGSGIDWRGWGIGVRALGEEPIGLPGHPLDDVGKQIRYEIHIKSGGWQELAPVGRSVPHAVNSQNRPM